METLVEQQEAVRSRLWEKGRTMTSAVQMRQLVLLSHSLLGAGIRAILERSADWQVHSLTQPDPERLMELARAERPEITILDSTSVDILGLFESLCRPGVQLLGSLIVISRHALEEQVFFLLMKWGMAAHLTGWLQEVDVLATIRRVCAGEYLLQQEQVAVCSPRQQAASERRHDHVAQAEPAHDGQIEAENAVSPLSCRETEVLTLLAEGKRSEEIAGLLHVGDQTIKNYLTSIYRKVGIHDRTGALVSVLRHQWIPLPASV